MLAAAAGDLYATAWTCGCVLQVGEPADSPRAVAQAGPRAAVLLHRAADLDMEGWQNTSPVPNSVKQQIDGYVAMARGFEPHDARYLNNHRGHFIFLKPEERKFVTAELIRRTTFTATEQELEQRVEALRGAGWSQFVIPITPGEDKRSRIGPASSAHSIDRTLRISPTPTAGINAPQSCVSCHRYQPTTEDRTPLRPPRNDRQRPPRRRGFDDDNFYDNAPSAPPSFPAFMAQSSGPEA